MMIWASPAKPPSRRRSGGRPMRSTIGAQRGSSATSANGYLHLGHALSALVDFEMARALGGRFLLRIEDIDAARCRPDFEQAIYDDLAWLGIEWEQPVRRQSEHFGDYRAALARL